MVFQLWRDALQIEKGANLAFKSLIFMQLVEIFTIVIHLLVGLAVADGTVGIYLFVSELQRSISQGKKHSYLINERIKLGRTDCC